MSSIDLLVAGPVPVEPVPVETVAVSITVCSAIVGDWLSKIKVTELGDMASNWTLIPTVL